MSTDFRSTPLAHLAYADQFIDRHLGPDEADIQAMLEALGLNRLDELLDQTIPESIRQREPLELGGAQTEHQALAELQGLAHKNRLYKNYIGMGYYDTLVPPVIQRNILENPGWYTAYTPYQPEISQGRLEMLLNFQQMVMDLTGMEMANASLLDEATAAAEAMAMCRRQNKKNHSNCFFVDRDTHPQTLAVLQTRAEHFGLDLTTGPAEDLAQTECFGALLSHPGSTGQLRELTPIIAQAKANGCLVAVASDLMALMLLQSPGEMGADIVLGTNQRFGIPMGFGGPHAAFFAFREAYKRSAPGRIIGVSVDSRGKPALRMAMQTREQHIRREKANSNICTSQVLLAVMSAAYAVYHGPEGLRRIAERIHRLTALVAEGLKDKGFKLRHASYFDTLVVEVGSQKKQTGLYQAALTQKINLRLVGDQALGISLDETTGLKDVHLLLNVFCAGDHALNLPQLDHEIAAHNRPPGIPEALERQDPVLGHPIFNRYHSETELLRYLRRLEGRDIALNHSMIPLGSCTMKLNATAEMLPVSWPEFNALHPFAPLDQAQGYQELFAQLQQMLKVCTGYAAISLQPNAGSQGEYAGLVAIKKYFESRGEPGRDICLIPVSAHGTNPASAQMAGLQVKLVNCDKNGNVDLDDLQAKVDELGQRIAAIMITYPSTHGVFEEGVAQLCELIHSVGAQVYIDGANMNALVGLAAFGQFGGDVSHLNLHKTFCIPHGGGGPGMGPIGVAAHLAPFLPSHPVQRPADTQAANGTVSAAPWGSASLLPISWMYLKMMGAAGTRKASEIAILNANYVASRLAAHYPILYKGRNGTIAHECLLDLRPLKDATGVTEEDIAKRLMDYGFHAPTMSFPVAGSLMIEPTESESKEELDRFCEAMIHIREEVAQIEAGDYSLEQSPLRHAPHTQDDIMAETWERPYSRETAARPAPWLKEHKIWPAVNRVDNVYGDRNLICSCPSPEAYSDD